MLRPTVHNHRARLWGAILLTFALCRVAHADVKVNGIFGDHMVLQRDATVPVWGEGVPGEKVTVTFRDETAAAVTQANGEWRVELKDLEPGEPSTLTIAGKNSIAIKDVLVGDVWLCSGQSNLAFRLDGAQNSAQEAASANYPLIRHFREKLVESDLPLKTLGGQWDVRSPATAKQFIAIGYFFAKEIQPAAMVNRRKVNKCAI